MKQGMAYLLVLVIGAVIGVSLMHQFGHCRSGRPVFRDASFFEHQTASPSES